MRDAFRIASGNLRSAMGPLRDVRIASGSFDTAVGIHLDRLCDNMLHRATRRIKEARKYHTSLGYSLARKDLRAWS